MLNPFLLPSHSISTSVFFPSIFVKHVRAYRVFLFGRSIELTVKVYFLTIYPSELDSSFTRKLYAE